ncbi:hypothetical protein RG47T_0626 [Mucilaginibacter polytrichastri]|uniref:DUF4397 domain-containing protein n=1 Tax=Mucilaginibacter polytrichastri TaxID=1302689 RepID=A0A1Q5ZTT4_9SPHI|nr:hypothetical protein RG47T_0626 [Mucilaginibacter polytrichastri]
MAISFSACVKDNNRYNNVTQPVALISAINASPDAQPVDFFLDQNRTASNTIKSGESQDYIRAYTGKRNLIFYAAGSSQKIISDTATLKNNTLYSVFLANVVSKPDLILLTDTLKQPASGMATIRFINLSPDAPAADLAIKGGNVLVSNKAYKAFSGFITLPVNAAYNLEIRQAGTSTVLASLNNVNIKNGLYTVWLQGIAAATDQTKLSAHIQNNVYYY